MDHIIVKKKKSHRTAVRWIAFIGWFLGGYLRHIADDRLLDWLIMFLIDMPVILMLIYFEEWAITLYKGEIIRNRWGRLRSYTWSDIQQVTSSRSATEGEYIRILFLDGKAFQFRKEDENAQDAVKLILKQNSIKHI